MSHLPFQQLHAVILAGGVGTRLWPLSRQARPKQFATLVSEEPLLVDTYRRLLRGMEAERIFFSTSSAFAPMIQELFPEVPPERIIVEPEKRDTGPAMGYVAAHLELIVPDAPVVFVPSDHYVRDEERFLDSLRVAGMLVEETGKLLDIAVPAAFPSTILGYTRVGEMERRIDDVEVYHFAGHTEKPDYETAKRYLEDDSYLWHASYYTWTPRAFLAAFERYAPATGAALREVKEALRGGDREAAARAFGKTEPTSFDYAVTEKMDPADVLIIKGDFGWSDIGGWDTLYARLSEDREVENIVPDTAIVVDARGNLVRTSSKKLVALVGVENIVVIDTDDALLVTTHAQAQRVKEVLAQIRQTGHDEFL